MAKATQFTYKGTVYDLPDHPTMGEMAFMERACGYGIDDMVPMERTMSGILMAIRRGQLAAGVTPLMSWAEVLEIGIDEWDYVKNDVPEPPAPAAELPESEWPLDPKDDETRTGPYAEYGPRPPLEPNPWTIDYGADTSNSPTPTTGLPTRSEL